jgi:RNA polymerase sigma factor (sigma-70 family)
MLRDVTLAEDLTQEALVAALEHWPATGVPEKPGAWLMATAKRRALDDLRRRNMLARKHELLLRDLEQEQQAMPDPDAGLDDDIGDELLRLIFTACHPRLSREARAALALRMICGLTTEEIARAFLQPEATIAQRIVRAKRTLSESGLAYETPHGAELSERLASVLEVVYLIFNEGYTAARGDEWLRPQLCDDALRMGRVLTLVAPQEAEAYGLLALMELNASRMSARTDAAGDPVLLMDPNRMLWDRLQIRRGLSALARACELGGTRGFYVLQAAIVACHARAATPDETDWPRIAGLYAELAALVRSPVIELNRAVAVGMAESPAAALSIVDRLVGAPALKNYHLLESVRGDLLFKLACFAEARTAFEAAARLAGNRREQELLQRRAVDAARRCEIAS